MNILFYKSDINKIKHFQHVLFDFYITKQNIKKWLDQRYPVLCEEFENEKKKGQKIFDLPERGFEPRIQKLEHGYRNTVRFLAFQKT